MTNQKEANYRQNRPNCISTKLGTATKDDKVILVPTKKRRYVGGGVTEDDRYLVITAANSTYGNELYIKDLTKPNSPYCDYCR
jgi:protease II